VGVEKRGQLFDWDDEVFSLLRHTGLSKTVVCLDVWGVGE
jgi:hypothetical protein